MQEENATEKVLIKGPKKTMSKLSTELFDELAKEGIARVEGLGTFRKSGSSFEFIPSNEIKIQAESQRVSRKIVDLTEEDNPYWLNNTGSEKRARIPNAGNLELSDVLIPSGRTQQKILQDRYEKRKVRLLEESRNKRQKNYRIAFGAAAVLAVAMLSSPLWVGENEADINSAAKSELVQEKVEAASTESNTLKVSTSLSDPADALKAETANQVEEIVQDEKVETAQASEAMADKADEPESVVSSEKTDEDQANSSAANNAGTRVQKTKAIEAIGPELGKKESESDDKSKVKVTPLSHLKAEVAVGNQFAIVAASMQTVPSAKTLADELRQKGFVAEVVVSPVDGKTFYRVVLGRFETAAEASEANKALGGDYWVTRLSFASQLLSL